MNLNYNNNFENINTFELSSIDGGCGWCYVGGALVVIGATITTGPWGGALAFVGVLTVFRS